MQVLGQEFSRTGDGVPPRSTVLLPPNRVGVRERCGFAQMERRVSPTDWRIWRAVTDLNPQAKQMADESMVRTLEAQARAIWPQESELIRRYRLPDDIRILDAGCGTGEGSSRLAEMFPRAD